MNCNGDESHDNQAAELELDAPGSVCWCPAQCCSSSSYWGPSASSSTVSHYAALWWSAREVHRVALTTLRQCFTVLPKSERAAKRSKYFWNYVFLTFKNKLGPLALFNAAPVTLQYGQCCQKLYKRRPLKVFYPSWVVSPFAPTGSLTMPNKWLNGSGEIWLANVARNQKESFPNVYTVVSPVFSWELVSRRVT